MSSTLQHRRTHNLLLISKLLNQRDASASPFTLILDSLEQSGKPLLAEFMKRANAAKVEVIFVSFGTLRRPANVDHWVRAWGKREGDWEGEVREMLRRNGMAKKLLVLDDLNSLAATSATTTRIPAAAAGRGPKPLPDLLSSFIGPTTSLLALYHLDVPLPSPQHSNTYAPSPLTLLRYLATTIFTTHSLHHILERKAARERSHAEPSFGLLELVEDGGVMQGIGANGREGVVVEMEHRRRSGRGVGEWYFLPIMPSSSSDKQIPLSSATLRGGSKEVVMLLEDHPKYRRTVESGARVDGEGDGDTTTFELRLTERQKKDREGVVLPYFDAQKSGSGEGGEGGRILYDLGSEDDFDEDEDEI